MPRSPEQELQAAQRELDQARQRRADIRSRRRTVELEGTEVADAIRLALYEAGRRGEEPKDIDALREKVTALQLAHSDLVQLEEGASRAVADAENHLRDTRFRHAPAIEQRLVDQVASLTEKRAELEAELGRVASAEHALRAAWQELAEAVPGCPDPIFGDAEAVPARRPTEPHPGISAYVVSADWPGWFAQVVRQAAADFGSPEAMRANGVDPERERMRREAAQPIGG